MSLDISDRARKLWDEWNLRVAVLISLLFQIVLIFSANSRRRKGGILLTAIIWSSYLLADWIAAFAVGLISSGQTSNCPKKTAVNNELAAFWAPFLLLHLGGPDDITAFSLEDNELWIRHLLGLIIQVVAVVYVFVQSLPNEYWIPTALLFFAGVCKYAERTLSFYKACLGNFKTSLLPKPDSGPNYAQLMEEFSALEASHVPVKIDIVRETAKANNGERIIPSSEAESLDYLDIVLKGYHFFDVFKGLVVDHMFSFHERDESRFFFFKRTAADAFRVMEVELNFLYDVLFTKMGLVHCKIGYLCRLLATALLAACFLQFASHPHHHINHFDKIVTYVLLVGAVALDLVGVFKLVFSDWVIVSAKEKVARVLIRLPFSRREQRWSDSMAQHGFISFCLNEEQRFKWLNKIVGYFRMKELLDEFRYKKKKACGEKLKKLVFDELKAKALNAETTKMAKEIYSARGDNVLSDYPSHYSYPSISASLSDEVEYDESLLLWHIATELCYFTRSIPEEDEAIETTETEFEPQEEEATETEYSEEDEATETKYSEEDEATDTEPEEDEATETEYSEEDEATNIYHFDKIVTYILLVGAVCLDLVGVFKLLFSDWVIISVKENVARVLIRLPFCRREQRWSDSMAQHSFISFCLNEEQRLKWLNKITDIFGMKEVLDELRYKDKKPCGEKLKELVFDELRAKALNAESTKMAKDIHSTRGFNVLLHYPSHYSYPSISDSLSDETEYDESLLLWHIATELCYFTSSEGNENREFCKVLSDYMLYLLVMRPTLMSTVAGIAQIRFQDTCKEANKFFKRWQSEIKTDEQACEKLLAVKKVKNLKPNEVKGDRSKSLLFDACILANDLKKLNMTEDRRWEMMSRVWVELLSYAASCCRPTDHARQLSHGGEFITFVWLLMVHFGLGEQFRAGQIRAQVVLKK